MEVKFFFFSYQDLKSRVEAEQNATGSSEHELIKKGANQDKNKFDVFISYSYLDDPVLPLALSLMLKDNGCSSYIPERIDRNSGYVPTFMDIDHTRNILMSSQSLIMINGPKTSRSQWIPWEIGFISGRTGKVAVSSTADKDDKVKNREFLKLYPSIVGSSSGLTVSHPGQKGIPILDWARNTHNGL